MNFKPYAFSLSLVLALSSAALAADYPDKAPSASFDYQGQTNLGLAPETPDDAVNCRNQDQVSDTDNQDATTTDQTAPVTATKAKTPDAKQKATKQAKAKSSSKVDQAALLSAANDLEKRKRKCGALTDAAMKTAGYIESQALVASGSNAAGLIAATAFVAGGAALALGGQHNNNPAYNAPLPIPGAGLLSYLVMALSVAFVWGKRQLQKLTKPVSQQGQEIGVSSSAL